jgi:peroxiredoxin
MTDRSSLEARTHRLRELMREALGAETLAGLDAVAEELGTRSLPARGRGDLAPDFQLPDARGGSVRLGELAAAGPVVLIFYRGSWCPYCNLQLDAFRRSVDELNAAGASLVAVSPEVPDGSIPARERPALPFPVLTDLGNEVAGEYGLTFSLDPAGRDLLRSIGIDLASINRDPRWELPAAATYVVDRSLEIVFAAVSADYRWRVGPAEVLQVIQRSDGRACADRRRAVGADDKEGS